MPLNQIKLSSYQISTVLPEWASDFISLSLGYLVEKMDVRKCLILCGNATKCASDLNYYIKDASDKKNN